MRSTLATLILVSLPACFQSMQPGGNGGGNNGGGDWSIDDAIAYRDDMSSHPGCSTAGLSYPAADIPGYRCAAKAYPVTEDTSKPIVLLIHGNSDSPLEWEKF